MIRVLTVLLFVCIALMVIIPVGLMATDIALKLAEPLVCTPGEILVRTGSRNIHFYCEMTDGGERRDVSWLPMLMIAPLVGTIGISVLLAAAQSRRKAIYRQAWTTAARSSGFSVTSDGEHSKVVTFTSGSGEPVVIRVTDGEAAKVIQFDPDNPGSPVTVRKAKHGDDDASGDAQAVEIDMGDFFKSDLLTHLPNLEDNTLKAKLEQLQEAYQAGLITQDEYERKKQDILDSF